MLVTVAITAIASFIISGGNVVVAGLCAGTAAAIYMSKPMNSRLKTGPQS